MIYSIKYSADDKVEVHENLLRRQKMVARIYGMRSNKQVEKTGNLIEILEGYVTNTHISSCT